MNPEIHAIDYKPKFKPSDLEEVTLQAYDANNRRRTKKCKVFLGEHGIEALLLVEERFRKIAANFGWADQELFENFEEVLTDVASDNWEAIYDDIPAGEVLNDDRFDQCIEDYYLKYCSSKA